MKIKEFIYCKMFYMYPFDDSSNNKLFALRIEKEDRIELAKNKLLIKAVIEDDPWTEDEIKTIFEPKNYYKLTYNIPFLNHILLEDSIKISVYNRNSVKKNRQFVLHNLYEYFRGSAFALFFNTDKEEDCNNLRKFNLRHMDNLKSDLFEDENNN